jgi:nucleotide-binding universal stress UspA family protein
MKILIAHDGSESANAALNELHRAGLPNTGDALFVAVADVFIPPPGEVGEGEDFPAVELPGIKRAHDRAAQELERTRARAEQAGRRFKEMFPSWVVTVEAHADSPAWAIVRRADEWKPDLIVVGSEGHSSWGGRLILGSVAQRVLYEAPVSVRIARAQTHATNDPVRIIVGLDGSANSGFALDVVAARNWPAGSEARVVVVLDGVIWVSPDRSEPDYIKWIEADDEKDLEFARAAFAPATQRLRDAGLITSLQFVAGRPKRVLVAEADSWNADTIFLGAKGMRGVDRFLLGSVAAAVAARASCSVEVVRPKPSNFSANPEGD